MFIHFGNNAKSTTPNSRIITRHLSLGSVTNSWNIEGFMYPVLVQFFIFYFQVKMCRIPSLPGQRKLVSELRPIHAQLSFESSIAKRHPVYKCSEVQVVTDLSCSYSACVLIWIIIFEVFFRLKLQPNFWTSWGGTWSLFVLILDLIQ